MITLGISGGLEPVYRPGVFRSNEAHDAAAVLLVDGEVACAIEEERLNRVKHTNAMPVEAVRRCLDRQGITLADVDCLAIYGEEAHLNEACRRYAAADPAHAQPEIRAHLHRGLIDALGEDLPDRRLRFVHHHLCHAMSAFVPSGFDASLVVTIDGVGDRLSGMILSGRGTTLKVLRELPEQQSLGDFYSTVVRYLGFGDFDEYKVMGLAPYGDPAIARDLFRHMYTLQPHGDYTIHWARVDDLATALGPVRRPDEPLARVHMDVAAALQEALEAIVGHLLAYYRESTGHQHLCLAGGVAQNCSLNGRLLASGLFRGIFVQPASYDAGCALGAAWYAERHGAAQTPTRGRLTHVFWGSDLGETPAIARRLSDWQDLVAFTRVDDPCAAAAQLLADGAIVGWAQGRSEFGPRALGHRSILADPRPAANKDIVNAVVKKREAFRPFAPAVLAEDAREYFDLPADAGLFAFMTFVVSVRLDKRSLLGAVTHVDGTARPQTVSRDVDPLFWRLIASFKALTGVPVVLNTSFNNNVEPIVDSIDDAVSCFLTTGLHRLIVGDFVVTKVEGWQARLLALEPAIPPHVALETRVAYVSRTETQATCWLTTRGRRMAISLDAGALLQAAACGERPGIGRAAVETAVIDGAATTSTAFAPRPRDLTPARAEALSSELARLWADRWITVRPRVRVPAAVSDRHGVAAPGDARSLSV